MARRSRNILDHYRLRKVKAALLAVSLTLAGVLLMMVGAWLPPLHLGSWSWIKSLPIGELGGTLFGAGLLTTLFEYSFRKDQEAATVEQFRQIIHEQAPAMRDAVIEGFAIHPEDLRRVANPDLLDTIAANVMALRLGDEVFARELYAEVRDQAIRAPERWLDVEADLRLSTAVERGTGGTPLFDLTVEWEYTTIPSHSVRRFVVTSDKIEFDDLQTDIPATAAWLMTPRPGMDASSRDCFELLSFSVDGIPQAIRRAGRRTGQTYSVTIPDATMATKRPVRIRHVYRVVTPSWGHRLFLQLPQPARDLSLSMDYTDTDIAHLTVTDTVSTNAPAQVHRSPDDTGRMVTVDIAGWLLPRAGFAFTWTLNSELPRSQRSEAA